MSDKKQIDDEIGKELENRLDDDQGIINEDDYTVKVHREDYTVKRRFFDKGKALEAADSLRMDKRNIVEDNIEHDFVTLIDEEDDVDWDKLVDQGLEFFPPISDAAEKKLDQDSRVAEELEAERAMVSSELDKTLTMGGRGKVTMNLPKIEKDPPPKPEPKEESQKPEDDIPENLELETAAGEGEITEDVAEEQTAVIDDDIDLPEDTDSEETEPEATEIETAGASAEIDSEEPPEDEIDEDEFEDADIQVSEEDGRGKSLFSSKKLLALLLVVIICGALFFFFGGTDNRKPSTVTPVQVKKVVKKEPSAPISVKKSVPEVKEELAVKEELKEKEAVDQLPEDDTGPVAFDEPETLEDPEVPMEEEIPVEPVIPEVTKFHQYTVHISSYRSRDKAISEVKRIRKKGYDAYSAEINIPGKGQWHRVYAGYYNDYKKATAEAAQVKKRLREDTTVAKTIYAVQVGDNGIKEALKALERQLTGKGYTPYWMPVNDTEYVRLIVGAYRKEKDAKAFSSTLSSAGFEARAVKR